MPSSPAAGYEVAGLPNLTVRPPLLTVTIGALLKSGRNMTFSASLRCRTVPGACQFRTIVTLVTLQLVLNAGYESTGQAEALQSFAWPVVIWILHSCIVRER